MWACKHVNKYNFKTCSVQQDVYIHVFMMRLLMRKKYFSVRDLQSCCENHHIRHELRLDLCLSAVLIVKEKRGREKMSYSIDCAGQAQDDYCRAGALFTAIPSLHFQHSYLKCLRIYDSIHSYKT